MYGHLGLEGACRSLESEVSPSAPVRSLARAVTRMPRANALPGSLSYEPKWDGYRCVAIHDDTGVTLWSRQGKELTGYSVGVKRRCADFGLMTVQFSVRDRCRTLA